MPALPPLFKFGSFMVRVSECAIPLLTEQPCIPPSCSQWTICIPPGRTLAKVAFDPRKTDPKEFRQLLQEIIRIGLQPEVVVRADPKDPTPSHEHVGRALR